MLQISIIADSMVMSLDSGAQEEAGEVRTEDNREPEVNRPKITDREKELAAEASASYNSGDFGGCLATLEKLEVCFFPASVTWSTINALFVYCR